MRRVLVWLCVAAVVIGFFLPWAKVDLRSTEFGRQVSSRMRESLGKTFEIKLRTRSRVWGHQVKLSDIPTQVSGVQVPVLANREEAGVAMDLIELFTGRRERIGLKSYAVYLLPGLAVACGLLLTVGAAARRPVAITLAVGVAALCLTVAAVGAWKSLTINPKKALIDVKICTGLWLSFGGYAGLAVAALTMLTRVLTVGRRCPPSAHRA